MSFITLIIVISILVFVHELGHFLVAKLSKVRVDEFSIGFPPRLWSKQVGETLYSLNIILIGGYVKIFGENPDEESINGEDKERSFVNKNRAIQASILVAGITMNILFAWLLLSTSFFVGVRQAMDTPSNAESVYVSKVMENSPASRSGIKANDLITKVGVDNLNLLKANSVLIEDTITKAGTKPIVIEYNRDGKVATTSVVAVSGIVEGRNAIGIGMMDVAIEHYGVINSLIEGAKSTVDITLNTFYGLFDFFGSFFALKANLSEVSGPVGIASYLNQARTFGLATLLSFVAMISINLAVINLMPFPALDGGRLLFVLIEAIIRRPINPKIANALNIAGFAILLLLMVVVTFSDIAKLLF